MRAGGGCRCRRQLLGAALVPPGAQGDSVKNPIFLVIICGFVLISIAGLTISSARLIGLF